eukprot:236190-Pyramimonas_sp.AAC.1
MKFCCRWICRRSAHGRSIKSTSVSPPCSQVEASACATSGKGGRPEEGSGSWSMKCSHPCRCVTT